MTTDLILTDIDPTMLVSCNRRIHYQHRNKLATYWRLRGKQAIEAAYGHADEGCAWHQRVRIVVTFRYPNKIRRDIGNLYPFAVKPLVDGMVQGGRLLPDDTDEHLVGPDMRRSPERGPLRIEVSIQDLIADWGTHLDDPAVQVADVPGVLLS